MSPHYHRDVSLGDFTAALAEINARMLAKMASAELRPVPDDGDRRAIRLAEMGVPTQFRRACFATSRPLPALKAAEQFLLDEMPRGRCLVLCGDPGGGKTHAMVCVLEAAKGIPRKFHFLGNVAGILLDGGKDRRDLIHELQHVPLLALDDLGVEYEKKDGVVDNVLDRIFWQREADCLATIITSNLGPEKLTARYAERIIDRLRDRWGRFCFVESEHLRDHRDDDTLPAWVRES